MMKKFCNTLLFIGFATNNTVAISEIVDKSSKRFVMLNAQALGVEANVTQVKYPPELFDQAVRNIKMFEPSLGSAQMRGKKTFLPLEGIYNKSKVRFERLCTVSSAPNEVKSVTSIVDVNSENKTFVIRESSPENPDLVYDTLCKLYGHGYYCQMPTQKVDFASSGLDAVLTISGIEYGAWKEHKKHTHIPSQKFSCEGADCGIEPASNLHGILTEMMPCTSFAVYEYKWHSALLSETSLIIKSVNTKKQEHPALQNLATQALIDSDDRFEAILFDYQSQETIADLVWKNSESSGKIVFEVNNYKDEVSLQIANIEDMPPSQRYRILLQGLHEAGIAWLNQRSEIKSFKKVDEASLLTGQVNHIKHGAINLINSDKANDSTDYVYAQERVRYAEGWAYDPDDMGKSIWVHLYGRTHSKSEYQYIGAVYADQHRPDVNQTLNISGNHGFKVKIPAGWNSDNN
jgi:hypothetical protein